MAPIRDETVVTVGDSDTRGLDVAKLGATPRTGDPVDDAILHGQIRQRA